MDTKLLLVKSITLLYLESIVRGKASNSADLVNQVVLLIKGSEAFVSADFGKDPIMALRETARWMASNPVDMSYDKTELLQRIRVNVSDDDSLFAAFAAGIEPEYGEEQTKGRCHSYRTQLKGFLDQVKIKELVKKAYMKTHYQSNGMDDWSGYIKDLRAELEQFQDVGNNTGKHKGLVSNIMVSDREGMQRELGSLKDELSGDGAIQFGIQGLNRMFGYARGGRRGELVVVGALQSNYKSGFSLDMLRGACSYNTPYMLDKEKKPLIMRIALENPLRNDIMHLYKSMVEQDTGFPVDLENLDVVAATDYVTTELQKNGYNVNLLHYDPSDFTYHDLFEVIEEAEADGYELHMLEIDYPNLMNKRGCDGGPMGADTRALFRRIRNFINNKQRRVLTIVPHQLSTDAKIMTRQGFTNFVKEIANKGYYDSCRTLDQEVDVEIYLHKEVVNGESFLTIQRGKHRGLPVQTPLKDLYCVYKFEEVGNIWDDVLGDDASRKQVGGGKASEGSSAPWWSDV